MIQSHDLCLLFICNRHVQCPHCTCHHHSLECPTLLNIHLFSFLQITTQISIILYHRYLACLQKTRKRDHPHLSSNALQVSVCPMISLQRSSPSLLPCYNLTLRTKSWMVYQILSNLYFPITSYHFMSMKHCLTPCRLSIIQVLTSGNSVTLRQNW